jgi:hypothetical protein
MALFQQAYNVNQRTITGLINPVFQDDVVLNCDTSLGSVAVQLLPIPYDPVAGTGNWSTQYRLVVTDSGNNAAINNIIILAPAGYTINGLPSVIINANGVGYYIVVGSNTNYIALLGGAVSGGSGTGLISLTNAQMLSLINAGSVIPNQFYLITDAGYGVAGVFAPVIIQGVSATGNQNVMGSAIFLNADFQNVGDYSGVVPAFVSNKGIWYDPTAPAPPPPAVVVGDIVIWNNIHFVNLTGSWWDGVNDPSGDATNWLPLARSRTNGYIEEVDQVRYNVNTNLIIYRADKLRNEVDLFISGIINSIGNFQWGRLLTTSNKVRGNGFMNIANAYTVFRGNIVDNSRLIDNSFSNNTGLCEANTLENNSLVIFSVCNLAIFTNNSLSGESSIIINTLNTGTNFRRNSITNFSSLSILSATAAGVELEDNVIANRSSVSLNSFNSSFFAGNNINTGGRVIIGSTTNFEFIQNNIYNEATVDIPNYAGVPRQFQRNEISSDIFCKFDSLPIDFIGKKCGAGFSDFETSIDCSNPLQYDLATNTLTIGTLAIPALPYQQHYGLITLENLVTPISKIRFLAEKFPTTIKPDVGNTFQITMTLVAVALPTEIVGNTGNFTITGRVEGSDYAAFQKSGNINQLVVQNITL